jgi:phycocyanobilin:ferredoxin oxidoreductase
MTALWNELIGLQTMLEDQFNNTGTLVVESCNTRFNHKGWIHSVWESDLYRRAHIDIIDERETRGLWMLHCCIFPHIHNPAPIFGFDIVAGRNKVTGCFHDYSPAGDKDHPMIKWFEDEVAELQWNKLRTLPEWAVRIFTPSMIAASNIQTSSEITQIINTVNSTSKYYLAHVASTNNTVKSTVEAQNYYAQNQKLNPHTPKVMAALGLNDDEVDIFIHECLFPEM